MNLPGALAAAVRRQARDQCEYCQMHQSLQGATFHLEHVIPRVKGGSSDIANLALACPGCNLHKADRTTAIDPETGAVTPLFNPRRQQWSEHFRFDGEWIQGLTAIGRTTVAALDLNHPRRRSIRNAERRLGLRTKDQGPGTKDQGLG